MADRDCHLHGVLDGYAKFLQDKYLAMDRLQPYRVRGVRQNWTKARSSLDKLSPAGSPRL
jgi:hypothetical protein